MGFIDKLRTLLDDSDDGSPDRETRAGNNTRHFPESRTIKLVVSVTFIGTRDHGLLTRQWQAQRGEYDMASIRGQYSGIQVK